MKRIRINAQLASEAQASDTSTTSDQESENTNLIGLIDLTKSNVISEEREGYTPASILTISGTNIDSLPILPNPDAPIYGGWKYVNAERSLTARMAPNYDSEIYAYLPRNNKIEVTNIGALWSTVSLNEKSVFVRTKYLRDEIEADTMRLDRLLFQNLNQYTDTNIRRVRTHGLNVRK
jgi:hypothetical protein